MPVSLRSQAFGSLQLAWVSEKMPSSPKRPKHCSENSRNCETVSLEFEEQYGTYTETKTFISFSFSNNRRKS